MQGALRRRHALLRTHLFNSQLPQALTSVEKGLLYCVQTLSWLLHTLWSAMRPAFMVATFDPALSLERATGSPRRRSRLNPRVQYSAIASLLIMNARHSRGPPRLGRARLGRERCSRALCVALAPPPRAVVRVPYGRPRIQWQAQPWQGEYRRQGGTCARACASDSASCS